MLFENSVVSVDDCTVFLNGYALNEAYKLVCNMLEHTIADISVITGISKDVLFNDYKEIHDYNLIREMMKDEGKWNSEMDKSIALVELERIKKVVKGNGK